ncbi:MAG: hypothetical protein ACAH10_04385 [Methylophilaceae bacterium]
MSDTEKSSVAALISVILRRKINRVIDVKWLVKNPEYAREIINISRELDLSDLNDYASHLENLMFGSVTASAVKPKPVDEEIPKNPAQIDGGNDEDNVGEIDPSKYVGSLR